MPRGKNFSHDEDSEKKTGKRILINRDAKGKLQPIGMRNPYAIYRRLFPETPLSELSPEKVRSEIKKISKGNLEYAQLFDPRFGSFLYTKKTIQRITKPDSSDDEKPEKGSPKKMSLQLNDSSENGRLVGSAPDYTKCEENYAVATWVWNQQYSVNDPNSLYWPWFSTCQCNSNYPNGPEQTSPLFDDPRQGDIPDCYLISALSSIAWYCAANKKTPRTVINPSNPVIFTRSDNTQVTISGKGPNTGDCCTDYSLPVYNGTVLLGAKTKPASASWVPFYEKALALYFEKTGIIPNHSDDCHPNICKIPAYDAGEMLRSLMKRSSIYLKEYSMAGKPLGSTERDPVEIFKKLSSLCATSITDPAADVSDPWNAWFAKYPVVAWTNCTRDPAIYNDPEPIPLCAAPRGSGVEYLTDPITASHAYSLLGLHRHNGINYVILRDPWGENYGYVPGSGGYTLSPATYLVFFSINISGGGRYRHLLYDSAGRPINGIFALQLEDFAKYFAAFDWVLPP